MAELHETDEEAVLAPVHYLHGQRSGEEATAESDSEVLEGEVVSEEEYRQRTSQKAQALQRYAGYRDTAVTVARTTRTVAVHRHTRTALRHVLYVPAGAAVVGKRLREAHSTSRYERVMRSAEAAGDFEQLAEWESRAEQAKQRRHQRIMDWIKSPMQLVKALAVAAGSLAGLLVSMGILLALANKNAAAFLDPFQGLLALVRWTSVVVTVAWGPLVLAVPWGLVLWLWHEGRQRGTAPQWVQPASAAEPTGRDAVPDENAILQALRHLDLPSMNRALKDGWSPRWVMPTQRDGRGWRTQVQLPQRVPVSKINEKKTVLAHNLVRKPREVWPTEPRGQAGVLDLWVADQGVLEGPMDPHPLKEEGTTDYFTGVPVGVDARGEPVTGKLMGCNYIAGGTMGSGKTSLAINIAAGAILDPLVDVDVHVMAFNADFDPLKPALRELVKGDEEEQIEAAVDKLRQLRQLVTDRGKLLDELGGEETKLTRDMVKKRPDMRPRVVIIDECQELFEHDTYGEEAVKLAEKVAKKARKTGITLLWATPSPSAASLPRDLAKTASHRVCFAIGDHQGNDAVLGTGKHSAGITATDLVAGEDVGTAMADGFRREPGLLRCYHLRKDKNTDELTPVVQRATAARQQAGITTSTTEAGDQRHELEYLTEALAGEDRPLRTTVLERLRELHPTYRSWSSQDLAAMLRRYDLHRAKSNGQGVIRKTAVEAALESLHEDDSDDETAPDLDEPEDS